MKMVREIQDRLNRAQSAHNRALWGMAVRGRGDQTRETALAAALNYLEALAMTQQIRRGDRVRVVSGRKVPIGFVGTVFWIGDSRYGVRVGLKVNANNRAEEPQWTALDNVAPAGSPDAPALTEAEIMENVAPAMAHVAEIEAGRIVVDSTRGGVGPRVAAAAADNVRAALAGYAAPVPAAPAPALPPIPTQDESRRFALLEVDESQSLSKAQLQAIRDEGAGRFGLLEVD